MKPALLIDADILAYIASSSNEKRFDFGDDEPGTIIDLETAKEHADKLIQTWVDYLGGGRTIICLSDPTKNYFRKAVLPTYKAKRSKVVAPTLLGPIKDYLAETHETFMRPTLEADDVMGILSTNTKLLTGPRIIVSDDKDMKTIPGLLYRPKSGEELTINKHKANYWHLYQTLMGDSTDGYSGCPGVGPKKAERILEPFQLGAMDLVGAWNVIVKTYENAGLNKADALVQAQVARICRSCDYNYKLKVVKLWQAPR